MEGEKRVRRLWQRKRKKVGEKDGRADEQSREFLHRHPRNLPSTPFLASETVWQRWSQKESHEARMDVNLQHFNYDCGYKHVKIIVRDECGKYI